MDGVGAFTGADAALAELRKWLSGGRIYLEPVIALEGPSGSGKSFLARSLVDEMEASFECIIATGDGTNATRDLLPFQSAYYVDVARDIRRLAPEFASAVPFGSAVKPLLQYAIGHKELQQTKRTDYLDRAEHDVLFQIQRRTGKRRLLIVLDNVRSWDKASLRLLQAMWSPALSQAFPFLARTSYLAVMTPEDPVAAPEQLDITLASVRTRVLRTHRPSEGDFPDLLRALGLRQSLTSDEARDLYALSGGHLELSQRLAQHLNRGERAEEFIGQETFERFCLRIIDDRLRDSAVDHDLQALLSIAAVIGLSFSIAELSCLAGDAMVAAIGRAKALNLLVENRSRLAFVHDLIYRVVRDRTPLSPEMHGRFAECLRLIDPGAYATRAKHLEMAGRSEEAAVMQGHALLNSREDANPAVANDSSIGRFVLQMREARLLCDSGAYEDAIAELEHAELSLPASLLMERDGVLARCLIKTLDVSKQRRAVEILGAWIDEKGELEVWQRLMQQYVVALGFVGDMVPARAAARRLVATISRAFVGEQRQWMIHRLSLNACVYEGPDGGNGVLRDAVDYFGPSDDESAARDPYLYWVGISNLIANELLRGDFSAALGAAERCAKFVSTMERQTTSLVLPRRDIAVNNSILAEYFAGNMPPATACDDLLAVASGMASTNDSSLIHSNVAGFRLLDGKMAGSAELLRPVFEIVSSSTDKDPYYIYYIGNNLVAALLAEGAVGSARRYWEQITPLVGIASPNLANYLRPRHELLSAALAEENPTYDSLAAALSEYPQKSPGPAFAIFAMPVLLSDLQFFSDL